MRLPLFIATMLTLATSIAFLITGQSEKTEAVAKPSETGTKRPVLVELFTSEGCSSCPPADRLLTEMSKGKFADADTITLAYHVDYWDRLGWKDRFSSAEYSQRQETYASKFGLRSIYTPQMVVNGTAEFVGNNRSKGIEVIGEAGNDVGGGVDLSSNGGKLTANIRDLPGHGGATIYLAVAESGLFTKVGRGENAGSTLEHTSVVRHLSVVGKIKGSEKQARFEIELPSNSEWKQHNLRYVVFAQEDSTLRILAVNALP